MPARSVAAAAAVHRHTFVALRIAACSTPHAARLDDRVLASALRLRWRRCIENPVNHMFPVSALQARRLRWLPLRTTAHANRIAHILHAHANEPGWSSEHGVVWARSLSHGAW